MSEPRTPSGRSDSSSPASMELLSVSSVRLLLFNNTIVRTPSFASSQLCFRANYTLTSRPSTKGARSQARRPQLRSSESPQASTPQILRSRLQHRNRHRTTGPSFVKPPGSCEVSKSPDLSLFHSPPALRCSCLDLRLSRHSERSRHIAILRKVSRQAPELLNQWLAHVLHSEHGLARPKK